MSRVKVDRARVAVVRDLSPYELGWLIGFWEGEGSCGARMQSKGRGQRWITSRLSFSQKDLEVLFRVRELIGLPATFVRQTRCSSLVYTGPQARVLMQLFKPLVSERRRKQIQRAEDVWTNRPLKRRSPGQIALLEVADG